VSLPATISFGQYAPPVVIRMVRIEQCTPVLCSLKESKMRRLLARSRSSSAASAPARSNQSVRPAVGYELSPLEVGAVHGGELKIEMPAYVPLSQSHPKTEVTLPRVPYK
jgi:hypothetical protein